MTKQDWLQSSDPHAVLDFLQEEATERKLRLFACSCCRRVWHLLTDERTRHAVTMTEDSVDGFATADERFNASMVVTFANPPGVTAPATATSDLPPLVAAHRSAQEAATAAARSGTADSSTRFGPNWRRNMQAENREQCALLRDIFGHMGPIGNVIDESWLTWRDRTIPKLAQAAYDERQLPIGHLDTKRLAILADALEESGCTNEDVLAHLRGAGPHVRGCWVVDSLLGKE